MTWIRSSLSTSIIALSTCLVSLGCSGAGGDESFEFGSAEQALHKKSHGKHGADKKKHKADKRQHKADKRRHEKHCRWPHRPCAEEPEPEPVTFTPATAAERSGRRAGVAVAVGPLANDARYAPFVAEHFSDITPENETKWGSLQPESPRRWDFEAADTLVDFAKQNDMAVKGHTLVWHQQLPSFIDSSTPRLRLAHYTTRHIHRAVRHYKRDMYAWDVVNEAIADDGSGLRETPFSAAFGEHYIDTAFRLAHRVDRDAKLYYNDYGIEGMGPKSDAVYALVERLLDRHVPIDGVGFQGHFDARFVPSLSELVANFQRFADLGLRVNVSELDVRIAGLGGSQASKLAVQKQLYQRIAAACMQVEACDGITTWGFTDAYSWIDSTFGPDDPLLLDDAFQKKPAYFGYVDGWLGVPLDESSAPNLIGNSSLEAGLDGWSVMGDGTLATEMAAANTGLRSARVSGRTASWQGPRHDITALVSAARSYDAAVAVSIAGAATATAGLTAQISCAGQDDTFQPIGNGAVNDAGFTTLSGTLSVPDCDILSVAVYAEGPDAGVDVIVDDLVLREQPQASLIGNGDFESGTGGWFGFGPVSLATTTDAHGGNQAAIATARTDTWQGIATDVTAGVQPNGGYRASAWMKIAGAASDRVGLTAAVGCAGTGTQFLPIGSATATSDGWVEVSGTVVVPNCTVESFVVYGEGPAAGVDLLLDDVAFWQVSAGEAPNVITNSGFESGAGDWFGFGSVVVEATTERAHSGSQSGRVSGRTDSWNGLATSLVGRLTPGRSYSVSAWAQVGAGSVPVNLTFQNGCEGGATNFTFLAGATASDAEWTQLQGTLVAPDCNLTTANFYIEGAPAGTDIYLDDVEVRELP